MFVQKEWSKPSSKPNLECRKSATMPTIVKSRFLHSTLIEYGFHTESAVNQNLGPKQIEQRRHVAARLIALGQKLLLLRCWHREKSGPYHTIPYRKFS